MANSNTDLNFFMAKLKWLFYDNDDNPFIKEITPEIQKLYWELGYLIGSSFKEDDVGNWKTRLTDAAKEAEDSIDMFISSAIIKNDSEDALLCNNPYNDHPMIVEIHVLDRSLKNVMNGLKSIREEMSNKKGNFQSLVKQDMIMDRKFEATANLRAIKHEELVVGLEDDVLLILDRLTGDRKKLDIISIVGMGGVGKTTLATKIFNDSLVEYHFDKRGWAIVSQAYSKQGLLLQLLASIGKSVDEETSESKLCEMLYQMLKRRKYLIVIDDIWSCKAWDDVGICFPDDKTGSRVLLTTRLTEVASHASQGGFTHNLPHLTEDQSWELLCRKTFRGYECPESLTQIGKHIAKKCGGLPLALVVIAGVLEKEEKRKDLWEKIAERVGSYIIDGPTGCLVTLALSYDHLPSHLKKCFLYVGGFPEDYNIQVRTLIKLWMAEGLINDAGQRSLEEEGEYYLRDLVDRNLLIVVDKRSNGGIKSCCLHDLLRELCLKKASKELFFEKVSMPRSNNNLFSYSPSWIAKPRRLFADYEVFCNNDSLNFGTRIRSVLCFPNSRMSTYHGTASWFGSFLLLKVLDLVNIPIDYFCNIGILVHLRYLAVWSNKHNFSFSKANLWSLQTLIIKGKLQSVKYSPDNMVNLRHLRCDRVDIPVGLSVPMVSNLQTISRLKLDHRTQCLLQSFGKIKKLGCSISSTSCNHGLISFAMLTHLEALNIDRYMHEQVTLANPIRFPETLKKLTLKGLRLPWIYMSTIQRLPKLEVLKLLESSFWGHLWETGDEQFHHLKYLKLEKLNIRVWEASSINFPRLRKLAVRSCKVLSDIPIVLGNISTLEHIEIDHSNSLVRDSVYRIQKAQREMENYDIQINFTHMDPSEVFFRGDPFFD